MKKVLMALLAVQFLACSIGHAASQSSTSNTGENHTMLNCNADPQEKAGITQAIEYYLEAGREGDSKIAMKGFAPTATMSWAENGSLKSVPIKALYDYFDEKPRETTGEISACSVAGDVAIVRLESTSGDAKFTDMFTLVKDGKDWKIISKVYHVKQ